MKDIDAKIAQSEAEWRRVRYENAGVCECAVRLCGALKRSLKKRIGCAHRNLWPGLKRTGLEETYDASRENIVVSLTSTRDRVRHIFPTVYSLALQSRRPDRIVL